MKLLIVICDRNLTNKVLKILNDSNAHYHLSFYAKGTANSEILSYFGLAEVDKEVILSFIRVGNINSIMEKLSGYEFIAKHGAVAFAVPLDGIGKNALSYLERLEDKDE